MAPKSTNANASGGGLNLSAREQELISHVFQCFTSEPQVDIKKFAGLAGFTNQGSASNAWRNIKTKIGLVPASPTTGGRKRSNKDTADNDDGDTPVKKVRARKTQKKEIKAESSDDEIKAEVSNDSVKAEESDEQDSGAATSA